MKPNWTKVYFLTIVLIVLTGSLGYGFALAFDAHSTSALIGGAIGLLLYAPIVVKLGGIISKEASK